MSEYSVISERGQEMMTYLPGYYETSRVMRSLMQGQGSEIDRLNIALNETLDQFFVKTATWNLHLWEYELGINSDEAKPIGERRSVILSKLHGMGTVTVELIASVAEAYTNGEVEVTESPESYEFIVKFISKLGMPPNMDDLKAVIEEVKPAHLAVNYVYSYLTFGGLQGYGKTIGYIEDTRIAFGELEVWGG